MPSEPKLKRIPYLCKATGIEQDYYLYLPRGYEEKDDWPIILFLHGNGERGDTKEELDFVLKHGPLYEAWIQGKELPFIIISPQLPKFSQASQDYIENRKSSDIPQPIPNGSHPYPTNYSGDLRMDGQLEEKNVQIPLEGPIDGWNRIEDELLDMLDHATTEYKGDKTRVYLTGLSYGGFGTWYLGSKYPDRFAALNPIVGFGHPDLAQNIATAKTPIWIFAGGRDEAVHVKNFYALANKLEELGHPEVRFTIHSDMGHDAWIRIYASQDLYSWFLEQKKD